MPLFDFPLEKLKAYEGINPRPADFDAYWERALEEMRAQDPQVECRPASAIALDGLACYNLFFTGVGGARVHAKYLKPLNVSEPHPAVLKFHGYSGNSGDWHDSLAYALAGYSVLAMDCRGQGGLSEDAGGVRGNTHAGHIIRGLDDPDPHNLLFRNIFLDTAQLARIAMQLPEVDPKRVGVLGGSQGGALTLACASLEPKIRLAASTYPFLSDYLRVWEMDLAKDAYSEITNYFRLFDPRHERKTEVFTKLGYIDIQHLAPRIKAEVLMFTGLMDTICPPSSQFAAFNKITSPKNTIIFPDFRHEHLPGANDTVFNFMMKLKKMP